MYVLHASMLQYYSWEARSAARAFRSEQAARSGRLAGRERAGVSMHNTNVCRYCVYMYIYIYIT